MLFSPPLHQLQPTFNRRIECICPHQIPACAIGFAVNTKRRGNISMEFAGDLLWTGRHNATLVRSAARGGFAIFFFHLKLAGAADVRALYISQKNSMLCSLRDLNTPQLALLFAILVTPAKADDAYRPGAIHRIRCEVSLP